MLKKDFGKVVYVSDYRRHMECGEIVAEYTS
jgi:hypothetical protein